MGLKATRKERKDKGGVQAASELEGHTDNLRFVRLGVLMRTKGLE